MEQIVQAYIQAKGLDEQQAQQLIQELQKLDEQQLQQVVANMQQQLGGQNQELEQQMSPDDIQQAPQQMEEEMMMQYGGKKTYEQWKQSLPNNLKSTDTTLYNLRGAYEGGLYPELSDDGFYHLGSRNPKTGELLKSSKHPTFNKMIEGEKKAGYEVFEKNGKLYSRPKLKQQYGGVPVSMDGLYEYENTPVIVPNGNITMEGIDYPVDAYDADTMQYLDTMQPNQQYQFEGVDNVLEIPKGKFGISKMQAGGNNSLIFPNRTNEKVKLKEFSKNKFEGSDGNLYIKIKDKIYRNGYVQNGKKINTNVFPVEQNKLEYINNTLPEVVVKGDKPSIPNYFKQPESKYQLPSKFNISTTTPVQNQNLSTSTNKNSNRDEFGFVKDLSKVKDKSRKDNINDYKSWVDEWNSVIPNFKSLTYPEQQKQALDWIKKNQGKLDYNGVLGQLNNWGYKDSPDKLLTDGMFAEGTNLMRPSNLQKKRNLYDDLLGGSGYDTDNTPNSPVVPQEPTTAKTPILKEDYPKDNNEEVNMDDVVLGKLNNKDYSGRYLSNMKLRNNTIKMPYFGRTDLKNPSLYTQNISPYINELYAASSAAKQNLDMNSAVGQSAQIQLGANLLDRVNDVSGKVYNTNMQQTVNWENALAGIYNKQQQMDEGNRRQYDDDVNRIIANKQNVDNQIDKMAYEFKQTGVRNKNNMLLSQMLHPNYIIQDDGTMVRKGEQFNKGYNEYLEEEMKRLKEENEKLKTKVAKYGIRRKK